MSTRLVLQRIETEDALASLRDDWVTLESSSGNTLPFRTFAWISCWWKHLHENRRVVKDALAIRAVRSEDGKLIAVAPMMWTERPAIGPLRARCLQFIGADPNVTEVRGVLCDPSRLAECYAAIRSDIGDSADWLRWSGIEDGARDALDGPDVRWNEGVTFSIVDLPATWEQLRATRSRNLKESLRKCRNSLARDGLTASLEVAREAHEVEGALADFFRLHAARAELTGTVRHKDVFADPACRTLLVDVCTRFAERNELRIFRLRIGAPVVATRIGFVLGGSLYFYYSGFDPAYAKYGVMTTTVAEAMQHAIREGLASVNLSSGKDVSKSRWSPREVVYRDALIFSPHKLARAKYEALEAAHRAMGRVGENGISRWLTRRSADVEAA